MPEARQNNSKLAEMLARASNFRALVGMAVDVVDLFMALLSFVESAPRAYRLKASTAAPPFSTSAGTSAKIPNTAFAGIHPPSTSADSLPFSTAFDGLKIGCLFTQSQSPPGRPKMGRGP